MTTELEKESVTSDARKAMLVSWVMTRVERWRRHRDTTYAKRWAEYYRLWRGFWDDSDKSRDSERSKLIAPALQQAIEMTVAEMEEAAFGRESWIDVSDDVQDQEKQDAEVIRDVLIEDFEWAGVQRAVAETFLNGAIYGTGIAKIRVGKDNVVSSETDAYGDMSQSVESRIKVFLETIHPLNFVIDPAAKTINEALGCAHELVVPKHKIEQGILAKRFYQVDIGQWAGEDMTVSESGKLSTVRDVDHSDSVYLTEYHGLVPKKLLDPDYDPADEADVVATDQDGAPIVQDGELVEAIITIANKSVLLKERESPYVMKDRCIIAYQHETVPNQFWGRGVAEKGYNPQKALDAELRARMDALGLFTYPVMGADATRLPRGLDLRLRPGKFFLVNGRPSEVLEPISFGNLDPSTFQNSADLERMVQMGTGAMDSAIPSSEQRRNETVGGMGMLQSGFLKRAKRTMNNVEQQFLKPLVQKSIWRYMQFNPERYPADPQLVVKGTMGIMAREVEQQNLIQLMQVVPPESPAFMLLLKGIIENSVGPTRGELTAALEQMMAPNPEAEARQQKISQLEMENMELTNKELFSKVLKAMAEAELARAKAEHEGVKASLEDDKVDILAAQVVVQNKEADIAVEQLKHSAEEGEKNRAHEKEGRLLDKAHTSYESDKDRKLGSSESSKERRHSSKEADKDRKISSQEADRDRKFNSQESDKDRKSQLELAKQKAKQPKPKPKKN